jgi:hypothetical protein
MKIVNNYAKISFDFGPTLLAWLEKRVPEVYGAILEADKESQKNFSGHGSALAQAYNHMILPLANRRDKYTQVLWGVRDFEKRFGRKPEGMWLPEAAVDLETLEVLSEQGIRFTILAPHQASRIRPIGDGEWMDVGGEKLDPTMPYLLNLSSGKTIILFFYDGPISRAVAFEGLLSNGDSFVQRLLGGFSNARSWPQLLHIATDGETYGHHYRLGDMALAYALHFIESQNHARLTNYGEYLEEHPPTHEVEIFENTSWSCTHGLERWCNDCGCNSGEHPGWHQGWRAPLREALDWLRDILAPAYKEKASLFLKDPWETRDDYIHIILDRSQERLDEFLSKHAVRVLNKAERTTVLKLIELQRHAMLMYTSCGWFFDELSGIETVQVIKYAGRALQLAREVFGDAIEPRFLELLERAKGNVPEHGSGLRIYEEFVKPSMLDLEKVCAHYAVSSLFEDYTERSSIYCYTAEREDYKSSKVGRAKIFSGRAKLTSEITRESAKLCFGVLHMGDQNVNCGIRKYKGEEDYSTMWDEISHIFNTQDFPKTLRLLDKHFGGSNYSLKALFRDQQRRILDQILESTVKEAEVVYGDLYENIAPMMRILKDLDIPPPKVLCTAAELVLSSRLRSAFEQEELSHEIIQITLEEARKEGISLDANIEQTVLQNLVRMAERVYDNPMELPLLKKLEAAVDLTNSLPFGVNIWKVQNIFYDMLQVVYPKFLGRAEQGEEKAREWVDHFTALGEKLSIYVEKSTNSLTLPLRLYDSESRLTKEEPV